MIWLTGGCWPAPPQYCKMMTAHQALKERGQPQVYHIARHPVLSGLQMRKSETELSVMDLVVYCYAPLPSCCRLKATWTSEKIDYRPALLHSSFNIEAKLTIVPTDSFLYFRICFVCPMLAVSIRILFLPVVRRRGDLV